MDPLIWASEILMKKKIVKNIPNPIFNHSQRARMGLNKKFGQKTKTFRSMKGDLPKIQNRHELKFLQLNRYVKIPFLL